MNGQSGEWWAVPGAGHVPAEDLASVYVLGCQLRVQLQHGVDGDVLGEQARDSRHWNPGVAHARRTAHDRGVNHDAIHGWSR